MAQFYPTSKSIFLDNNGEVLALGSVEIYYSLTGDKAATYTDSIKSGVNEFPIPLDSSGKADIFLDPGVYTVIVKDSGGQVVDTINNYAVENSSSSSTPTGSNIPIGGIIMYSGLFADIPTGWALCDGSNGRPNLHHKFIRGTAVHTEIGDTGGTNDNTVVAHTHDFTISQTVVTTEPSGKHEHDFTQYDWWDGAVSPGTGLLILNNSSTHDEETSEAADHAHTLTIPEQSGATDSEGGEGAGQNMPEYYTLAFIIRTE